MPLQAAMPPRFKLGVDNMGEELTWPDLLHDDFLQIVDRASMG